MHPGSLEGHRGNDAKPRMARNRKAQCMENTAAASAVRLLVVLEH